jgi:riboflavin kinase/FMN adenylyltransferase
VKIFTSIADIGKIHNPVVTVGTFDGLHIGHQKVISELIHAAKAIDGESVVVTFFPHPRTILQPGFNLKLILSRKEKIQLLEKLGVENLVCIEFTKEFAQTSSEDFIKNYIVDPISPKKFIIGYDHHFGKDRKGNIGFMNSMAEKYGFEVEQVAMLDLSEVAISSSKIRDAIKIGDMKTATAYLGSPYSIGGIVVKGNQIGRTLGFPTANIQPDEPNKIMPNYGVYASLVEWNGKLYKGMSNIGIRPTLDDHRLTLEVNIFDFDLDIYGEYLTLFFLEHIREEKKFRDLDLLRRRLIIDRIKVKSILGDGVEL